MQKIDIKLTLEELQILLSLTANQLFRIQFIDSKFPGHVDHPQELEQARAAVQVLKNAFNVAKGLRLAPTS